MFLTKIKHAFQIITNHAGFERYFSNTYWLFLEQFIRLITGLVVGVWVARYLGPKQFGVFSYAMAFVALFSPIASFGLGRLLVRDLVENKQIPLKYLGTAFYLRVAGSVICLVFVVIASLYSQEDEQMLIIIALIAFGLLFQPFDVIDAFYQANVQSKKIAINKLIQLAFSATLKLYFIFTGAELFWFALIIMLEQWLIGLALLFSYIKSQHEPFFRHFDWAIAKHYLKLVWPVILSGIVLMIQTRIDQLMLKSMLGDEVVGFYSAAARLIEAAGLVPILLVTAFFPAIINAKAFSKVQYHWRLYNVYRLMMVLFLVLAIPLYCLGEPIMLLLYGQAYQPSAVLFSLLTLRLLMVNYEAARNAYLTTENYVIYILLTTTIGALLNIVLNLSWIPDHGAIGAVWATVVSAFVTTFVLDYFYSPVRENVARMYKGMCLINFWH